MAYAVLKDVERLIAQFEITATGTPSSTEVDRILTDMEAEVNVALAAAGYTVPATAPAFFLEWLRILVSYGTAAAVLKSRFPDVVGPGENPAYAFWESRYKAGLKGIQNGSMVPPDAGSTSAFVAPSTYLTRNPDTEEKLGDIAEPGIKIGKEW